MIVKGPLGPGWFIFFQQDERHAGLRGTEMLKDRLAGNRKKAESELIEMLLMAFSTDLFK